MPSYLQRMENISMATMATVGVQTYDVLQAACRRDRASLTTAIETITKAHGNTTEDLRLLLALTLTMAFCEQNSLEQQPGFHQQAKKLVPEFTRVILFDSKTHFGREVAAWAFLEAYLAKRDVEQMRLSDHYGSALIYALAEMVTATCPSPNHGHYPAPTSGHYPSS